MAKNGNGSDVARRARDFFALQDQASIVADALAGSPIPIEVDGASKDDVAEVIGDALVEEAFHEKLIETIDSALSDALAPETDKEEAGSLAAGFSAAFQREMAVSIPAFANAFEPMIDARLRAALPHVVESACKMLVNSVAFEAKLSFIVARAVRAAEGLPPTVQARIDSASRALLECQADMLDFKTIRPGSDRATEIANAARALAPLASKPAEGAGTAAPQSAQSEQESEIIL